MWKKNSAGSVPVAEYLCSVLRFTLVNDSDMKYTYRFSTQKRCHRAYCNSVRNDKIIL